MGYSPHPSGPKAQSRTSAEALHDKLLAVRPRQRGMWQVYTSVSLMSDLLLDLSCAAENGKLSANLVERFMHSSRGEILISLFLEVKALYMANLEHYGAKKPLERHSSSRADIQTREMNLLQCVYYLSRDELRLRYGLEMRPSWFKPGVHDVIYGDFLREHSLVLPGVKAAMLEDLLPVVISEDPLFNALARREALLLLRAVNGLLKD